MKTVKNLKELEVELNKRISSALKNNVAPVIREVMKEKIEEEVYSVYEPVMYERTGGLINDKNIETTMIYDNTLLVKNTRHDGDRNVAEIVETGTNYQYDFEYNGVPRPFTKATIEHLSDTNKHIIALHKGLKNQGLTVGIGKV